MLANLIVLSAILFHLSILVIARRTFEEAKLDFLKFYETTTTYVNEDLDNINRQRRSLRDNSSTTSKKFYSVSFRAFKLDFKVILDRTSLLSKDLKLSVYEVKGEGPVTAPVVQNRYYQGFLQGDTDSRVHGSLLPDGTFDGVINTPKLKNTYYVEPAAKYPQIKTNDSHLVYRFTDLDFAKYPSLRSKVKGVNPSSYLKHNIDYVARFRPYETKTNDSAAEGGRERRYVGIDGKVIDSFVDHVQQDRLESMHCPLHVVIDHRYYQKIGKRSVAATIDETIYHVGQADSIFRSTEFDGLGHANNIGFVIAKLSLYKSAEANPLGNITDGADAQTYLTKFSETNLEDFCLGLMFTVVDFKDGVLGLAWIADPNREDSGICSKPYTFKNSGTKYFNSGIISSINYGRLIPRAMFSITVAHELGHNFGSEHDDVDRYACSPGGADGNYIMFHLSGDGLKPNHFLFSSCSVNYIYKVLSDRMTLCFEKEYQAFCSNAIVDEKKEECDCGTEGSCEDLDPCCNVFHTGSDKNCKLKKEAKCSAMSSRCCSPDTCDFIPASKREACSPSSDCLEEAYCTGKSAVCPTPDKLPDGTPCYQNLKVCVDGVCAKSVCQYNGYVDCYCSDAHNDCKVCCQKNTTTDCKPAAAWGFQAGLSGSIPVNGLCRDGRGICDNNDVCIFLDGTFAKADLSRLVKESANEAIQLLANYWYYAVLCVASVVFLIGLFIFFHRSNNPVQSMAYKDGRMAYVWFEARLRLAKIEEELEEMETFDDIDSRPLPFPIAARRLSYQFPTVPAALINRYLIQCEREEDLVKLLLVSGYPMRKLLSGDHTEQDEDDDIRETLGVHEVDEKEERDNH